MTLRDPQCTRRARRARNPWRRLVTAAITVAVSVPLVACGDDILSPDWSSAPDTIRLFSLARPDLNLPSGFSFNRRQLVRIETPNATGQWDLGLDTRDGELVFITPGALNIVSRARIQPLSGLEFVEVRRAPSDTTEFVPPEQPVPVSTETIYVVRTSESAGSFGRRCVYYAKLEPLEVDEETQSVELVYDSNPICNNRDLIPPDR